jgi:hypothetical protein
VLEGLAKFAHVINLEFFSGLIAALQDLLASGFLQHRSVLRSNLVSIFLGQLFFISFCISLLLKVEPVISGGNVDV